MLIEKMNCTSILINYLFAGFSGEDPATLSIGRVGGGVVR